MEYLYRLRVAFNPAYTQIAIDGLYLALPYTRCTVGVWSLKDITCKPLELEGHRKILASIALNTDHKRKILCSAADDYIIVWDIQECKNAQAKGDKIRGQIIGTNLGHIHYCAFSPNGQHLAACSGCNVHILLTNMERHVATLEGHTSRITSAEYCPHYSATLVTISEDRTFKVWNIDDLCLIYQSPILTASPFLCLTMNPGQPQMSIGTSDGQIRVFDLTDGHGFRQLHHIDVAKLIHKETDKEIQKQKSQDSTNGPKTVSSRPAWQRIDQNELAAQTEIDDEVEAGCSILGMFYSYPHPGQSTAKKTSNNVPSFLKYDTSVVNDLLTSAPVLLVGSTGALLQINAKTLELNQYINLQNPIPNKSFLTELSGDVTVTAAGSVYFHQSSDPSQFWCIVCGHFQNIIHIMKWKHGDLSHESSIMENLEHLSFREEHDDASLNSPFTDMRDSEENRDNTQTGVLTVLSSGPLAEKSFLKSELTFKPKEPPKVKKSQKGFLSPQRKGSIEQPITFHDRVKSSGYTAAPRTTMFRPQTDFSKTISSAKKSSSFSSLTSKDASYQYPLNGNPPSFLKQKLPVAERPTAVHSLKFSDDGKYLACGLANKAAIVFNMPLSGKSSSFVGHNHTVTCVNWSHDGNYVITSSDDKTASVWSKGCAESLMTIATVNTNIAVEKDGAKPQKPSRDNGPFPKEVKFAQFYYMDKFILLTSGSKLFMYKYHLDNTKQDIRRYLSLCKYKQVTSFGLESQQISAISAINGFYSYLVLCAGTNKSLEIIDMNIGKSVRSVMDIHSKPPHVICQNEGSTFTSHPADAYDLFVTAAAGDCIKLWDLRTNKCVRRYEGHMNRVYPCGLDISPCGRYIATGSEDKSTYIFDIRTGTFCKKLTDHTEVVSDVVFHPKYPELLSSSLDGKLVLYADEERR